MLRPYKMTGLVLQEADIHEYWPEATQEDLNAVGELVEENLMEEHWADELINAITIRKGDLHA